MVKAYEKIGSIKAVAEALGISRSAVRNRLNAAERDEQKAELEFPQFPDADIPINQVLDLMEQRAELRKSSYEAHSWFNVKVNDDKPIGVLWFGDPHLDDNGCDMRLLRHHAKLCAETDGLFGANIGDTTNNWAGSLARLYASQDSSLATARRLASWFMLDSGIKWAVWLIGNHDAWGDGAEILAQMAAKHRTQKIVCHDWEARFTLQFTNGAEVRVNAAHDFSGNSQWNPLHGAVKQARFGGDCDLLVCGHKHNWAVSQWELADKGTVPAMIRVKGYKTHDSYARRLGHYEQQDGAGILTIMNPRATCGAGKVTVFADVDQGVDYLKWLRRKP